MKKNFRDIFSKHFPSPSAAATVPQVSQTLLVTFPVKWNITTLKTLSLRTNQLPAQHRQPWPGTKPGQKLQIHLVALWLGFMLRLIKRNDNEISNTSFICWHKKAFDWRDSRGWGCRGGRLGWFWLKLQTVSGFSTKKSGTNQIKYTRCTALPYIIGSFCCI